MEFNNLPVQGGQEILCINTDKVYDWVINEATFDLNLVNIALPLDPTGTRYTCDDIDLDTVTCRVTPDPNNPFVIGNRVNENFIVDGEPVTLQRVGITKNFRVSIFVDLVPARGGGTVLVGSQAFSECEQVILCAPDDTEINVSYSDLDCFVCTANCVLSTLTNINVSVRLCQSIQSTFPVTLEILADFCQPREELPSIACPPPIVPPQCPVIFPNNTDEVDEFSFQPDKGLHPKG